MSNVFDVANYILSQTGPISAMKLQKLVYYCQVWSLVWDDKLLFNEKFEAWISGPVVRELYEQHRGSYQVNPGQFNHLLSGIDLSDEQKETISIVLNAYGDKTGQWLSDQTHSEQPWIDARGNLPENERGSNKIDPESIIEYYSSL